MIKQDFEHEFIAPNGVRSRCRVAIIEDDGDKLILFEDIAIGMSVTNASELIATQVVNKFGYEPSDCRFFETYREYDYDTLDEIEYTWEFIDRKGQWEANYPRWSSAEKLREILLG
jgi:hypothetical protein